VLALGSIGDAFVLASLLAVGGGESAPALAAATVAVLTVVRIGSSSLTALAGAQAVLGPAGWVGPPLQAAGSWASAAGLVIASPGGWAALPFGACAALAVAGPAPRTGHDVAIRAAAVAIAAACAVLSGRWLPRRLAWAGAAAAGAGLLLTVLG
jgi:hypothetical protein